MKQFRITLNCFFIATNSRFCCTFEFQFLGMEQNSFDVTRKVVEVFLRVGALVLLFFWCFQIISPFVMPLLWGLIIAVAVYPLHAFVVKKLRQRKKLSAILLTLLMLLMVILPTAWAISSITQSAFYLKAQLEAGTLVINEPPVVIKEWPFIGERLFDFLYTVSQNVESMAIQYRGEILNVAKTLGSSLVSTGIMYVQIIASVIIAGVLLGMKGTTDTAAVIFIKIVGTRGEEFLHLSIDTIRNVVKGILGVAVIQASLAGIGLTLAGVPHAGIWALLSLLLCIVQIGPGLVVIPAVVFLYFNHSILFSTLWAGYFVMVLLSDNILKPYLLAKGADVPMPIIFLGVIGGFFSAGFIGMFTGAIVLSISYKLVVSWMNNEYDPSIKNEAK